MSIHPAATKSVLVATGTLLLACGDPNRNDDSSLLSGIDSNSATTTATGDPTTGGPVGSGSGNVDDSTSSPNPTNPTQTTNTTTPPDPDTGEPPGMCASIPMGGTDPLIDDLEPEDGAKSPDGVIPNVDGRQGFWFTYNDETPGGVHDPGDPFVPADGGADGTNYSARTWGAGFTDWGAAMAVSINNDFSGDCPYDASAFDGIGFWAQGSGTVRVHVSTLATVPPELGGECNAKPGMCHDDHGRSITLSAEWTWYEIPWAEMTQEGWGVAANLDTSELLQIHWQTQPSQPFDFSIDELSFLGGEVGVGTTGDGSSSGGSTG